MSEHTRPQAQIIPLTELPVDIDLLCQEAAADGFRFMEKLRSDWRSGANRFDAPGEVLLGVLKGSELVAVGGLNRDPYTCDSQRGRLRHLYVQKAERRRGYATGLVQQLVRHGSKEFSSIELLTDTADGAAFYEALGFAKASSANASHELTLGS